jgi:hypothetical protein
MSWLSDTLGSVAGSVLGSAVQNHYNSANAAQANAWNVENYKHRYQWAVEDMRKAGLNPILAATNGIGGSISGASAASVGMSDIGSTMNSARAASAAERQAKNVEHLATSQIDRNVAEADYFRQNTHGVVLDNGIKANNLNLLEQTYEKRLGYELEKMNLELENLRLQGSYLSSGVLNNIASANRSNSAAAFDNIQTEMAGMERDFYKNLESLTGAPRSVARERCISELQISVLRTITEIKSRNTFLTVCILIYDVIDISFIFLVLNGKRGHSKLNATMIMFFYGIISCLKFHTFTSFRKRLNAAGVAYKKRAISMRSSFF